VPVPLGQLQAFSGIVSNAGNITLTNVMVMNDQPTNGTHVLGPITLAPGEKAAFTGSFPIPLDLCETNVTDTVTATGRSICSGATVTASQTRECPVLPQPLLVVTTGCPLAPVAPGGVLANSGTVSNGGTLTLTNVLIVSDHPTNNSPVFGPITLAPGETTNFTYSYQVCIDCCPPFLDTFTATAAVSCDGSLVSSFASASCPGVTTPRVTIRVACPTATALGELVFYSGTVSNSGDVLTSVTIADNQSGVLLEIPALATEETADFFGMYVATNCGPDATTLVTATAEDFCTGATVTNQVSTGCFILCPTTEPPVLVNSRVSGGQFSFDFATEPSRTYTVQYSDEARPTNWQFLTSVTGTGGSVTITDPATNPHRFYRVQVQ
jgi:hypothetical protein